MSVLHLNLYKVNVQFSETLSKDIFHHNTKLTNLNSEFPTCTALSFLLHSIQALPISCPMAAQSVV